MFHVGLASLYAVRLALEQAMLGEAPWMSASMAYVSAIRRNPLVPEPPGGDPSFTVVPREQ